MALNGSDWARGGIEPGDAVEFARALKAERCDLIHVLAGQTVALDRPDYGRLFLVPLADRIRNGAGIATLVGGNVTTADESNTILAGARSDLPRESRCSGGDTDEACLGR